MDQHTSNKIKGIIMAIAVAVGVALLGIFCIAMAMPDGGPVMCDGQVLEGWDKCVINGTEYDYSQMKERQGGFDWIVGGFGILCLAFSVFWLYLCFRQEPKQP